MPSLRPRLTQLCSTATTVMLAILMPTLDCTTDMPDTPMPTTTARGLLMPSLRPRLTQLCSTATTVMLATPMPTTTARGLLMLRLSPRLMPTTDTTATDLTATVTDMVATEDTTGDKSQYLKVQSKSSKRTSLLVI